MDNTGRKSKTAGTVSLKIMLFLMVIISIELAIIFIVIKPF